VKRRSQEAQRRDLEIRARELVAHFEWSEPPNRAAADVLQAAADALKAGALSRKAAAMLIAVWQPFAGLEAHAGNEPPKIRIANTDEELQRAIVAHMRALVAYETNPAKRVHLTRLLEKQIAVFAERGERGARPSL